MNRRILVILFNFYIFFGYTQNDRPTLTTGITQNQIKSDGVLDEPDWEKAQSLTELFTVVPEEGGKPSKSTRVRIIANKKFIVIGIECIDEPNKIINFSKLRDADFSNEDYVKIIIDPFQDGQSGYIFMVNPNGARYDALVSNRGERENNDWDGIWEAGTTINEQGWSTEIKIPIQSINYKRGLSEWGFNIERNIQRNQEIIRWANVSRDQWFNQTSRAGLITGLPEFDYGIGLNINPSLIGDLNYEVDKGTDFDFQPSLTVSQRLSANTIATATFNTDFAETEVDTRQTNLTRFPLFFPEKRAFFLEGSDIFEFGFGMRRDLIPFFSRKIGLVEGNPIPIVAGGKINGRINRTSFGGIVMNTAKEDIIEGSDTIVSIPSSTMGAFRIKQNIFKESSIGFLGTVGDPIGRSGSNVSGLDFTYQTTRFKGNKNFLVGLWGLYNDRVDLEGDQFAYGFIVDYPNDIWDASISYMHIGDGFDPSIGFVPRNGINKYNLGLTWAPRPNWKLVRQMRHELYFSYITDLNAQWQSYRLFLTPLNWRLESGERFEFNFVPNGERLIEPFEIAEGVIIPAGTYEFMRYRLEGDIAAKRKLNGRFSWWFGDFYGGNLNEYQLRLNWTPVTVLSLELSGTRNIASLPYGNFDQTLAGLRVRLNFTPDLQLNSFVQYDTDTKNLGMNIRLHWIYHPQGDFFVVLNNLSNYLSPENRFIRETSQILVKIRYNFRL